MHLVKGSGLNKGLAIVRVSSARQRDNASHEVQEKEILQYAKANGIDVVKTVAIVESAKDSENRSQYRAAVDLALTRDYRHLLFYMYDRESRNLTDNERNEKLVRAGLLSLHYAKDRKVIDKNSPDSDFFIRDIQAVTNKQFIRNLSAKVQDAMRTKAESGWFPGNHVPLGYAHIRNLDSDGKPLKRGTTIGLGPEREVNQVKREFSLRASGYSLPRIRATIIAEGYIKPNKVRSYSASSIDRRLKNEFYRGRFKFQGLTYQGNHPLFIEPDILRAVDALSGTRGKNKPNRFVFGGGFLTCHTCGCYIVGEIKKGQYVYYHCTNGKDLHTGFKNLFVREEFIWDQFGRALRELSLPRTLAIQITKELNSGQNLKRAAHKKELADTKILLSSLNNREDELYLDLKSGLVSIESYNRQIERIKAQRLELEAKLVQGDDEADTVSANFILELSQRLESIWKTRSDAEKILVLKNLLSNQTLDGATIRYHYREPFLVLREMGRNYDWRAYVENFRTASSRYLTTHNLSIISDFPL